MLTSLIEPYTIIIIDRTDGTRKYGPINRKCRFVDENILERFSIYSQFNCRMERQMKLQEDKCGCTSRFWLGNYPWCNNTQCFEEKDYLRNYELIIH
jgi:hypothetical protein